MTVQETKNEVTAQENTAVDDKKDEIKENDADAEKNAAAEMKKTDSVETAAAVDGAEPESDENESDEDKPGILQARPIEIVGEKLDSLDWPGMVLELVDFPEDVNKSDFMHGLSEFLVRWNALRNEKNAKLLSELYGFNAYIRGESFDGKGIFEKLEKSFKKHPDYRQKTFGKVLVNYLHEGNWAVRFQEEFTQSGKTTETEIFLVLNHIYDANKKIDFRILIESDIATDHNLEKKIGFGTPRQVTNCRALMDNIMLDAPVIRVSAHRYYEPAMDAMKRGELNDVSLEPDDENGGGLGYIDDYVIREYQDERNTVTERYIINVRDVIILNGLNTDVQYTIDSKYTDDIVKYCNLKREPSDAE